MHIQNFYLMNQKKSAFTLIELLVVIVIVGILATVSVAQFNGYQERARMARAMSFASQAKRSLDLSLEKTVGFWDFNEGSGSSAMDKSGRKNNFSVGTSTFVSESFHEGAQNSLKASGISFSPVKTNDTNTAATVAAWIKLDVETTTTSSLITISPFNATTTYGSHTYTPAIGYWTDGSKLHIRTGRWNTTPFNITDGKWYYHLFTMRQNGDETCEFKTYLDGVLVYHLPSYYCPNDNIDIDRVTIGSHLEVDDLGVWNTWYEGS